MKIKIAVGLAVSLLSLSACQIINSGDKLAKSSVPYRKLIVTHAKKNGVPVRLAHAVVKIESNYKPSARGRAGEVGLMQINPQRHGGWVIQVQSRRFTSLKIILLLA